MYERSPEDQSQTISVIPQTSIILEDRNKKFVSQQFAPQQFSSQQSFTQLPSINASINQTIVTNKPEPKDRYAKKSKDTKSAFFITQDYLKMDLLNKELKQNGS